MEPKVLKHYEKISLSDKNLFDILDGKNSLILYPHLPNYKDIDEVLGPNGMCVLLFEAKKNYGHWCCLWKLNPETVSFFNPYGGYPDDGLEFIPEHFAKLNNEDHPYLSILLDKSPYKLTYNDFGYQELAPNIRTCGRHCAVRLLCRVMDDDEYHDYVTYFCSEYNINADEFVTLLTMNPEKGF
jgi:hypothetical protein